MMEHLPLEKWTPAVITRDLDSRDLIPEAGSDIS